MYHLVYTALNVGLAAASCPLTALNTDNYHAVTMLTLLQTDVGIHGVSRAASLSNASDSAAAANDTLVGSKTTDTGAVVETEVQDTGTMEMVFVLIWCLVISFSPFILAYLQGETLSWWSKASNAFVTCWVIFGIVTCKNVHFSSSHFKDTRPLTLGESIYFMSQIISTVGYGDITPASTAGQVLVAILVLWAILIVADSVSKVALLMSNKLEVAKQSATNNLVSEQKTHFVAAVFAHLIIAGVWVAVLSSAYGWTLEASLFTSIVTLTTVGLGIYTPDQRGAQIFAAYWMIIGAASMANVVSAFGGLMHALSDSKREKGRN